MVLVFQKLPIIYQPVIISVMLVLLEVFLEEPQIIEYCASAVDKLAAYNRVKSVSVGIKFPRNKIKRIS